MPLLESVAGEPVSTEVLGSAPYRLTDAERLLLQPSPADPASRATGLLRTRRVPVAEVTLTVLQSRLPGRRLGNIPWPELLREDPVVLAGASRVLTRIQTGYGYLDAAGWEQPVKSTALLEVPGGPFALVKSGFYSEFTSLVPER